MDNEYFLPRVKDAIRLCETSSMPRFIGFLTASEVAAAMKVADMEKCHYSFYGGYDTAERVYFGVFPEWCEDTTAFWPIAAVTVSYRKQDKLTHRDFLGALMSLGITRETVGDILIEDGRAVLFLNRDILGAVKNGIDKIGRVGVDIAEGAKVPLPEGAKTVPILDTVASVRLDAVVAALANISRGKATELIESGFAAVNSVCVEKCVKTVENGDKITLKGVGKFIVESLDDRSRKGRIILKAKKFI